MLIPAQLFLLAFLFKQPSLQLQAKRVESCLPTDMWYLTIQSQSCLQDDGRTAAGTCRTHVSLLLNCLNQLDDDAWSSILLRKLKKGNLLRPLSSTCQHMRTLCHRHHSRLNLSVLTEHYESSEAEAWTAELPERFPSVSTLELAVASDNSYRCISAALPALTRCALCWPPWYHQQPAF